MPQYLDDNGEPVAAPKQYLDDSGNPVATAEPPPKPLSGAIGAAPVPAGLQGKGTPEPSSIISNGALDGTERKDIPEGHWREGVADVGRGIAKGAISTLRGMNSAGAAVSPFADKYDAQRADDLLYKGSTKASNPDQAIGKVTENLGEMAIPLEKLAGAIPEASTVARPFSLKAVQKSLEGSKASIGEALEKNLGDIQSNWHGNFRKLFDDAAKEYGVTPAKAGSLHDLSGNLAKALKDKAKGIYKQLDESLGGTRFQTLDEQIGNVKRAFRNSAGIDPEKDGILIERINALEEAKMKALSQAVGNGVDPNLIHEANTAYRRGSALEDLGKHVQASTGGLRADVSQGAKAAEESLSPSKLAPRVNGLYNKGRLQQALGEDRAKDLLRHTAATTQKAEDATSAAARMADAAKVKAEQQSRTVNTRRFVAGVGAASLGAPKLWETIKHFIGE